MASPKNLPTGTVKRRDRREPDQPQATPLVLSTKAKAKRVEQSQEKRDEFYAQIDRLYADGDKGANELLSKVAHQHKNPFKMVGADPAGAPKTHADKVDHPRLAGLVETVHRVTDTLAAMFKRKQIGEREFMAAEKYRTCFATLYGVMGGVGDFERSRGGSTPGQPPAPHYMLASETVSEVRRYLYPQDFAVVHRVCALGFSIEEATADLYGPNPTRAQKEDCGRRLREGLSQMADRWFPENRGAASRMRSHRSERPGATDAESVPQANVVHATRDKVYRTGK